MSYFLRWHQYVETTNKLTQQEGEKKQDLAIFEEAWSMSQDLSHHLWFLEQEGAAIRPAVTFSPDYKKIFTTEQITMTCDVGSTIGEGVDYIWYKDSEQVYSGKSYTIKSAEISHSGSYQCQTRPGEISDPARLEVIHGYVILQTPLYVYEGDDIYIRCHHYPGHTGRQTRFYKDDRVIRDWSDNAEYYIRDLTKTTAGEYTCTKEVRNTLIYFQYDDNISLSVQDLLSQPKITVINNTKIEGNPMTLSCDTTLSPYRKHIELQFAFYREGQTVQGFSSSNIYEVQSAQLEDSGNYICEAKTSTKKSISKRSSEFYIEIKGHTDNIGYTRQNIIRLTLSACVFITGALFVFHHLKWMKSMEPTRHTATIHLQVPTVSFIRVPPAEDTQPIVDISVDTA
ncbi:high affinity immunoglobulin gamma Fc receptor I-like [Leptodactylus fuscus]|uniref:high affinity immunoglobulin gamma Fc receptor I-like n=1 Tax=Leptodactylus fuscus TaxID=238119 RepID=UPI003F4EF3EB